MTFVYCNNTNLDVTKFHAEIMAAIANGGTFTEELADLLVLTKTPDGSDAAWVLNVA